MLVFDSPTIRVRHASLADRDDVVVVTFPYRLHNPSLEGVAFGEAFLAQHGLPGLLITAAENHGFLNDDAAAMVAPIIAVTRQYRSVVTYGSSLGGFAALLWSAALGAHRVVALSPRFTGNWGDDWARRANLNGPALEWIERMAGGVAPHAALHLLYDPTVQLDRVTAESAISRSRDPRPVVLPFAGHPVGPFLSQAGLMGGLVEAALRGTLDRAEARSAVRRVRADVAGYWAQRAVALARRANAGPLVSESVRRARALTPSDPQLAARADFDLGRALLRGGRAADAAACFGDAASRRPHVFKYRFEHAQALLKQRDWARAAAVLDEAAALPAANGDARVSLALARAQAGLRCPEKAVAALRSARRLGAPRPQLRNALGALRAAFPPARATAASPHPPSPG